MLAVLLGTVMRARDGRFRSARGRSLAAAGRPVDAVAESSGATRPADAIGSDAIGSDAIGPDAIGSGEASGSAEVPDSGGAGCGLRAEFAALGEAMGERATLLQFSTAFCAPCRSTRQVLAGVAAVVPGVRHVEVDAESQLALVRRLGVRRTPTVLIVDASGREVRRASGAPPTRQAVFATLAEILPTEGTNQANSDSSEPSSTG